MPSHAVPSAGDRMVNSEDGRSASLPYHSTGRNGHTCIRRFAAPFSACLHRKVASQTPVLELPGRLYEDCRMAEKSKSVLLPMVAAAVFAGLGRMVLQK